MNLTIYIVSGLTLAALALLGIVAWALMGWRNDGPPERLDWL